MSKVISMPGGPPPPEDLKPKMPTNMKDLICEECSGKYFRQVQGFKIISALESPTGKEQIMPIPTFRCDDCGYINKEFRIGE